MNARPVLYITGILLSILAIGMAVPMLVDIYYGSPDWRVFFLCVMLTSFFGGTLVLANTGEEHFTLTIRQTFLLMALSWPAIALFGALPLWLCQLELSFTDAFFESMSGITTTGATIITGLDSAPPGILIWRALLQWLGGIGIIVTSVSILPFLRIGGMQIFHTETFDKSGKALPRTIKLATALGVVYVFLTFACTICYHIAGMGLFDALAHAMTTISTGGFSTFDTSFGNFKNQGTEIVAIIFMILGALPFVLYLKAVRGNPEAILRDSQVRWFLAIIAISTVSLFLYLAFYLNMPTQTALMEASFNVVSLITGTGYFTGDPIAWGGFAVALLFFLMVVGGCAGSTTSGIKVFRFRILYAIANAQIKKLLHPHGVFLPNYNGKPLPEDVPSAVMGFFFTYATGFAVLAAALSFTGLDFLTSLSGAASAISNIGPGFGDIIGHARTFKDIPDSAKWALSAGMLFGRLELFTLLALLSSDFWKK